MVSASDIVGRLRLLIELREAGSYVYAARRLGVMPGALTTALSGHWEDLTLELLAAVVHGYGVDVGWVVTGGGPAGARGRTDAVGGCRLHPRVDSLRRPTVCCVRPAAGDHLADLV